MSTYEVICVPILPPQPRLASENRDDCIDRRFRANNGRVVRVGASSEQVGCYGALKTEGFLGPGERNDLIRRAGSKCMNGFNNAWNSWSKVS